MDWFTFRNVMIGLWVVSMIITPTSIGKPRKPKSERDAVVEMVVLATCVYFALYHWN